MIGIDLFAGSGGMSLGAKLAGVNVRLAIELERDAAYTYSYNHPETEVKNLDIRCFKPKKINSNKRPIILFGGPPCRGFSTSNQRTRNIDNESNWYFLEIFRIAKSIKPDWVLIENVKGLVDTENGFFLEKILGGFKSQGYTVSHWVLNTEDFGVPQRRSRLFIIGSLHGITINKPKPTSKKPVTVGEAIGDLPDLENGSNEDVLPYKQPAQSMYALRMRGRLKMSSNHFVTRNTNYVIERYKYIPQGGNWKNIPTELLDNYRDYSRCHTGIYHRLREDSPSVVIGNYRKNMLIHPIQNRGLSVREAARLQSFPDWYKFSGSIGTQQQQVGNAVPPLLARAVFAELLMKS